MKATSSNKHLEKLCLTCFSVSLLQCISEIYTLHTSSCNNHLSYLSAHLNLMFRKKCLADRHLGLSHFYRVADQYDTLLLPFMLSFRMGDHTRLKLAVSINNWFPKEKLKIQPARLAVYYIFETSLSYMWLYHNDLRQKVKPWSLSKVMMFIVPWDPEKISTFAIS